ncbi:MAG TPA: 6-phosphofructokinase [Thermodesulfobacteriota bacterium]|nr:6-phosphofructokinase [Deltaproteobacteria bacterium]HNR11860.1 6-phosphofructokinase [Thermodesulfobacteriota bacterium]HNU70743.1 6-phosphofructokinase [Thermodesulfobacteriota bacterium]HOC38921.1 6-phosphofructokinase [Thermodesulfobacteriota bacterium]HQO78499.1 6-phosphofructokinase [Thermodesulfobacteriota bacterium]
MEQHPIKHVGILFSGGPAPAANTVLSATVMNFINAGVEVYGFIEGFHFIQEHEEGMDLTPRQHYKVLTLADVSHIRNQRAIMVKTSRANPGKGISSIRDLTNPEKNKRLANIYHWMERFDIDSLITIGGDDTLKTANYLYLMQYHCPNVRPLSIVHIPKTIDNDYFGIDWTFGYTSAANYAAGEIRNLGADAMSTNSWFILEVMGRKTGWLTYAAGIAGEATRMISVEDIKGAFDINKLVDDIVVLMEARMKEGKKYGIVCISEGLAELLSDDLRPKEVDKHGNLILGIAEIGKLLAERVEQRYKERNSHEPLKVRGKQVGYEIRCTEPTAFDVLLGSQLGVGAFRAVFEKHLSGVMVSVEDQFQIRYVPFHELVDPRTLNTRIRYIQKDSDFYKLARSLEYQLPEDRIPHGEH